ncbi:hypothetical protein [Pantoea sp. At-9b]|nr:hypothetical protein [Pantoea sp. At-9b]
MSGGYSDLTLRYLYRHPDRDTALTQQLIFLSRSVRMTQDGI